MEPGASEGREFTSRRTRTMTMLHRSADGGYLKDDAYVKDGTGRIGIQPSHFMKEFNHHQPLPSNEQRATRKAASGVTNQPLHTTAAS